MASRRILFDLTDFLVVPLRTGIQRVCYEIVRGWPNGSELVPAFIDRWSRLHILPSTVLDLVVEFFQTPVDHLTPVRRKIQRARRGGTRVRSSSLGGYDGLLLASLFWEGGRVQYYRAAAHNGLAKHIFVLVYDMLPWLHPELFIPGFGSGMMPYVWGLSGLPNRAYISHLTREHTLQRIVRDEAGLPGPVVALGADSLGRAEPNFNADCRQFAVVGTLEPRKNHRVVMDAFRQLWRDGFQAELTFAGLKGWLCNDDLQLLQHLIREEPRFQWHGSLGDEEMARVIRQSRATIYPARMEGYGLPPVESLALGVPVIVTGTIPSITMLEPFGQIRMAEPTPAAVYDGVRAMLDDDFARKKTEEIRKLKLPSWNDLGPALERWILGDEVVRLAA